jgi:hypothetical protein
MQHNTITPIVTSHGNTTTFEYNITNNNPRKYLDMRSLTLNLPDCISNDTVVTCSFGDCKTNTTVGDLRLLSEFRKKQKLQKLRNKIKLLKKMRS